VKALTAVAVLGEYAAGQFGLVTAAQARLLGLDGAMLRTLLCAGALHRAGHGVYRLAGAPEPPHLEITVAWLRLDPGRPAWQRNGLGADDAVVSHRSACALLELGDLPHPRVELTVPRPRTARDTDVRLHRSRGPLPRGDVTSAAGLPVTTPARTIADLLSDHTDGGHVGGVIKDVLHRGLIGTAALAERVEPFAPHYAMPGATGGDLLAVLIAQAHIR
jgi:predicted transcriptional regulator of viral defense system